jgi:hypothetical protein
MSAKRTPLDAEGDYDAKGMNEDGANWFLAFNGLERPCQDQKSKRSKEQSRAASGPGMA